MMTPSPILNWPCWSVLVKIVSPPLRSSISLSWIGTAPLFGKELSGSTPVPIYSNEWLDAKILLCLWKGTVDPTPTAYGTLSSRVTVEIPEEIGVDSFIE